MMDGQERQKFPWGKWDWLSGGPCTPGPPKAEKRKMLLQGALRLRLPSAVARGFGTRQGPWWRFESSDSSPYFLHQCSLGTYRVPEDGADIVRAQTGSRLHGARIPGRSSYR